MNRLLTLGISETTKDHFKLIAVELSESRYIELDIKQRHFIDVKGEPSWDLFAITSGIQLEKRKRMFVPVGNPRIEKYCSKEKIKRLFEKNSYPVDNIFRNTNNFCICNFTQVCGLAERDGRPDYLTYKDSSDHKRKIKIKDYRWVQYWNHIYKNDANNIKNKKIKKWENYLVENRNSLYGICYRHTFNGEKSIVWVAGLHVL